ncbi:MAG: hypothetical protein ACYCSO_04360 [Cuniculiplasma sp.]
MNAILPEWRQNLLEKHLLTALIVLEFALSVVFLLVSYITVKIYFGGVGVGLTIAWVTGAIAYLFQRKVMKK